MARSSKRVGKPRCSSSAGAAPTTRFARTARWAINRRLPRPGNLGTCNVPRLTRSVVQESGAGHPVAEQNSRGKGEDSLNARGGSDGTAPQQKCGDHLHARVSSACISLAGAGRIFTIFSRQQVGFLRFEWLQISQNTL